MKVTERKSVVINLMKMLITGYRGNFWPKLFSPRPTEKKFLNSPEIVFFFCYFRTMRKLEFSQIFFQIFPHRTRMKWAKNKMGRKFPYIQ